MSPSLLLFLLSSVSFSPAIAAGTGPTPPAARRGPLPPAPDSTRTDRRLPATPGQGNSGDDSVASPRWSIQPSAQLRARAEAVSHYQLRAGSGRNDGYQSTRLRAGLAVSAPYLSAEVMGRHALSHDRDLAGGPRASDVDRWEVETASATIHCCARGADAPLAVRVGRQTIAVGAQRLVGVSDWANTRRAFDAVSGRLRVGTTSLDLFAGRPVVVRAAAPNRADSLTTLLGAVAGPRDGRWQLYALGYHRAAPAGADHRRTTIGSRIDRDARPGTVGYDVEGAWQTGHLGDDRVAAWFLTAETRLAIPAPWKPVLTFGLDAASGDRDADDAVVQTFHVPFASSHSHGGAVDVVGRANGVAPRVALEVSPASRLQLRATAYRFGRLRTTDTAYGKDGVALRPASAGSRAVGTEADVIATYRVGSKLRLQGGYGHFAPGAFLRAAPTPASALDWAFLATSLEF